jgi:hypothetical protein
MMDAIPIPTSGLCGGTEPLRSLSGPRAEPWPTPPFPDHLNTALPDRTRIGRKIVGGALATEVANLRTPAEMSPEQASADHHGNHPADLSPAIQKMVKRRSDRTLLRNGISISRRRR